MCVHVDGCVYARAHTHLEGSIIRWDMRRRPLSPWKLFSLVHLSGRLVFDLALATPGTVGSPPSQGDPLLSSKVISDDALSVRTDQLQTLRPVLTSRVWRCAVSTAPRQFLSGRARWDDAIANKVITCEGFQLVCLLCVLATPANNAWR